MVSVGVGLVVGLGWGYWGRVRVGFIVRFRVRDGVSVGVRVIVRITGMGLIGLGWFSDDGSLLVYGLAS